MGLLVGQEGAVARVGNEGRIVAAAGEEPLNHLGARLGDELLEVQLPADAIVAEALLEAGDLRGRDLPLVPASAENRKDEVAEERVRADENGLTDPGDFRFLFGDAESDETEVADRPSAHLGSLNSVSPVLSAVPRFHASPFRVAGVIARLQTVRIQAAT